jgi:hypothetical protein
MEISHPIDYLLARTYRYSGNGFRDFHEFRAFSRVRLGFVNFFQGHGTRLDSSPRRSVENVFEELESAFQLLQANIQRFHREKIFAVDELHYYSGLLGRYVDQKQLGGF